MMKTYLYGIFLKAAITAAVILTAAGAVLGQETIISGTVRDASSKEAMPGVTISFEGTSVGTSADNSGRFLIRTAAAVSRIRFTFIGYQTVYKNIEQGKKQEIDVILKPDDHLLEAVTIKSGKKEKYRNKDNPAVELIRLVIAHKKQNRLESFDFAQYNQYEKMVFALSNLSDAYKQKKIFKNYQFLFRQQDSTAIGGKNLLPVYMEEKISDNYYRKSPYAKRQIIEGAKQVKYDENFVDNDGLKTYFNRMYQDIDIYDNNISLLGNELLSPIADGAPNFYKFFIADTITDVDPHLIKLSFIPRSNADMLFEGNIYITMDGNYAVDKAELSVNKNIDLNFVRQMQAVLSFDHDAMGKYHLSQSDLKIDFGLNKKKGAGVFGERVVITSNFLTNIPGPDAVYAGPPEITVLNAGLKNDAYWKLNRLDTLKSLETGIYKNIDSLQTIPSFKRTMQLATLLLAGYYNLGIFEVGPTNTFYQFNPVEGFRLRLGGRTTTELSKRYYFETYGAYGFRDERFKYFLSGTYSLNDKSIYSFPQSYLRASFQHDTKIPGQELQFVQEDNFFVSLKRGMNTTWLYNDIFRLDYVHEFQSRFSYKFEFQAWNQQPAGSLYFENANTGYTGQLKTTDLSVELRYAPNEKYYQGKLYRVPIPDKYPVFTLRYNQGISGIFGGQYAYENITGNIMKRFYLSQLGYADVSAEGGYIFGTLPFPLLDIHRANQSYALELDSYNLMNYLEFVSDHYAAINIDQNFNGFFFNKVPLLKKLKWREVVSFQALYGGVRGSNNPATNTSLYEFPKYANGLGQTYTLNNGPYLEGGVGISNIFKVLRLDMVRRFSYLDHPDVSQYGLRARVVVQF